eukprot:2684909-Rhodomonas_salina.1
MKEERKKSAKVSTELRVPKQPRRPVAAALGVIPWSVLLGEQYHIARQHVHGTVRAERGADHVRVPARKGARMRRFADEAGGGRKGVGSGGHVPRGLEPAGLGGRNEG